MSSIGQLTVSGVGSSSITTVGMYTIASQQQQQGNNAMAINYNIVFRMDATRHQREGDIVVATPGGKFFLSYASGDNVSGSGAAHQILPTGKSFVDANTNWGSTSGQIAAYPTFYLGNNGAVPVSASPIGSGGTSTA